MNLPNHEQAYQKAVDSVLSQKLDATQIDTSGFENLPVDQMDSKKNEIESLALEREAAMDKATEALNNFLKG